MTRARRLSQAISEGDGISVIVHVADAAAAREAETQGAEGVAVAARIEGLADATSLPVLWRADGEPGAARDAGADAWVLVVEREDELERTHVQVAELGLECVVEVRDEEQVSRALEQLDPEIFLLTASDVDDDETHLDRVLALLPDVPAGKLAIAELAGADREEIGALERAGVDAVLVPRGSVAGLVAEQPPDV